jgi:hypothetical protein
MTRIAAIPIAATAGYTNANANRRGAIPPAVTPVPDPASARIITAPSNDAPAHDGAASAYECSVRSANTAGADTPAAANDAYQRERTLRRGCRLMRRGRYTVLGGGLSERCRPEESEARYRYRGDYAFSDFHGDTQSLPVSAAILCCIAGKVAAFFASRKTFYVGGPDK